MSQIAGAIFICVGVFFMLLAAVGAVRLPDIFMRLHAITKAATTGIGFIVLAVICFDHEMSVVTRAFGIIFFVALTAPVSGHLISRVAYFSGVKLWSGTFVDELRQYYRSHQDKSGDA